LKAADKFEDVTFVHSSNTDL